VTRPLRLLLTVALIALGTIATVGSSTASPAKPTGLTWWAMGDSYSAGEGLQDVDFSANPPGELCERATGTSEAKLDGASKAYSAVARDLLAANDAAPKFAAFKLIACTGDISNQWRGRWKETGTPPRQADLITLSMGGNNIGFSTVVEQCVGLSIHGGVSTVVAGGVGWSLDPSLGCDISEAELRRRIDMLVGKGPDPHEAFDHSQTLPDMYAEIVKEAVKPGGHVVVLGYPNLVEESGKWTWRLAAGNRCHRLRRSDANMLRSATGYLNEQIALAVQAANNNDNGVHFDWIDVAKIYENDQTGHHGLCTGQPWLNGLTIGSAGPDAGKLAIRPKRSFHPNQLGHDAVGKTLANVIGNLTWDTPSSGADIQRIDLQNTTYPAGVCRWNSTQPQPITVVGGKGSVGEQHTTDYSEILGVGLLGYADIDGDGTSDVVVETGCTGGGTATGGSVSALTLHGDSLALIGGKELAPYAGRGATSSKLAAARLDGSSIVIDETVQIGDEATCCYTGTSTATWRFVNGEWQPTFTPVLGAPTVEQASAFLRSYLLAAGARSYNDAWKMLSVTYKTKYGPFANNAGFGKFQQFWNGVQSVGIDNIADNGESARHGTSLTVDIWFDLKSGGRSNETVEVDIDLSVSDNSMQIQDYRFIKQREPGSTGSAPSPVPPCDVGALVDAVHVADQSRPGHERAGTEFIKRHACTGSWALAPTGDNQFPQSGENLFFHFVGGTWVLVAGGTAPEDSAAVPVDVARALVGLVDQQPDEHVPL
jgi:hypothetical protein